MKQSYFDGGLFQLITVNILGVLVTLLTFGICAPWAVTMRESWKAKHTVIDGRRLRFDGSPVSLFGQWIKWLLLTFITLGIYSFWVNIKMTQWVTENTHFENEY